MRADVIVGSSAAVELVGDVERKRIGAQDAIAPVLDDNAPLNEMTYSSAASRRPSSSRVPWTLVYPRPVAGTKRTHHLPGGTDGVDVATGNDVGIVQERLVEGLSR